MKQYQRLALLLRGEQPRNLLPPAPRGYVAARVRVLAEGPCCSDFTWNGGGAWDGKPWSTDLPTDSALLLYLFAAYLEVFDYPVFLLCWNRALNIFNHLQVLLRNGMICRFSTKAAPPDSLYRLCFIGKIVSNTASATHWNLQ